MPNTTNNNSWTSWYEVYLQDRQREEEQQRQRLRRLAEEQIIYGSSQGWASNNVNVSAGTLTQGHIQRAYELASQQVVYQGSYHQEPVRMGGTGTLELRNWYDRVYDDPVIVKKVSKSKLPSWM